MATEETKAAVWEWLAAGIAKPGPKFKAGTDSEDIKWLTLGYLNALEADRDFWKVAVEEIAAAGNAGSFVEMCRIARDALRAPR